MLHYHKLKTKIILGGLLIMLIVIPVNGVSGSGKTTIEQAIQSIYSGLLHSDALASLLIPNSLRGYVSDVQVLIMSSIDVYKDTLRSIVGRDVDSTTPTYRTLLSNMKHMTEEAYPGVTNKRIINRFATLGKRSTSTLSIVFVDIREPSQIKDFINQLRQHPVFVSEQTMINTLLVRRIDAEAENNHVSPSDEVDDIIDQDYDYIIKNDTNSINAIWLVITYMYQLLESYYHYMVGKDILPNKVED
jgi:hypothetical protein